LLLSTQPSACIVAVDINGAKLEPLLQKYCDRLEVVVGDISKRQTSQLAVDRAIRKFGHLDALVLNAAILTPVGPVATANVDEWKRLYDVNFFSLIHSVGVLYIDSRQSLSSI
jgi:NAD(P)-dependent dehydrogenase (short-subunit alcohol dehydrogenase family)